MINCEEKKNHEDSVYDKGFLEPSQKLSVSVFKILGILVAICAFFLAIPVPEIQEARESLMMVQFLVLLSLTVFSLIFAFVLVFFFSELGIYTEKKTGILDISTSFVCISAIFLGFIILNLWKYMIALHRHEWIKFMPWTGYAIGAFLGSFITFLYEKTYSITKENKYFRTPTLIIVAALVALVPAFWGLFAQLSLDYYEFLKSFCLFFVFNLFFLFFFILRKRRAQ